VKKILLLSVLGVLSLSGCAGKTFWETLADYGTPPGCIPTSQAVRLANEGRPVPPCYQQRQPQQVFQPQPLQFQQPFMQPLQLKQGPSCQQVWVASPNGQGQYLTVCR
jgi:hypothetical protein